MPHGASRRQVVLDIVLAKRTNFREALAFLGHQTSLLETFASGTLMHSNKECNNVNNIVQHAARQIRITVKKENVLETSPAESRRETATLRWNQTCCWILTHHTVCKTGLPALCPGCQTGAFKEPWMMR